MITAITRTRGPVALLRTAGMRRAYSDVTGTAGATGSSREFSKKEKAHEDQYARQREVAALEKLRKQIDDHKAELDKLQKQVEDHSKAVNTKQDL